MAKKDKWTIAGIKRLIRDSTPEAPPAVNEAAVVAIVNANRPILALGPQDPVPPNTPTGTIISRTL